MDKLLNAYELAEKLNVTHTTVYRWYDDGMPGVEIAQGIRKIVKFELDKCQEWLEYKRQENQ